MAMLKSYSISSKKERDYDLKFKVEKGVKVTITESGDLVNIHLNYDSKETKEKYDKNYKVSGPIDIKFFQNEALGKDGPIEEPDPKPHIIAGP